VKRGPALEVGAPVRRGSSVTAPIRVGDREVGVTFTATVDEVSDRSDLWLPVVLLPAMRLGADVALPGAISPRLLAGAAKAQTVVRGWWPDLAEVRVTAEAGAEPPVQRADGAAALFSGGVDSFYTAWTNRDRLTALVFGHGLQAERRDHDPDVVASAREAASDLGLELIEVTTDVRSFSEPILNWNRYHGGVLAAAGLLLSERVGRVHVPGWIAHGFEFPFGSHPDLDPRWSTEDVDVRYDGFEANRIEKIQTLAASDVALRHLRVCPRDTGSRMNCARCEKCLRTMVALRAVGALDRCATFPHPVDLERIERLAIHSPGRLAEWQEAAAFLETSGDDPALLRAIRRALRASHAAGPRRAYWALRRLRRLRGQRRAPR